MAGITPWGWILIIQFGDGPCIRLGGGLFIQVRFYNRCCPCTWTKPFKLINLVFWQCEQWWGGILSPMNKIQYGIWQLKFGSCFWRCWWRLILQLHFWGWPRLTGILGWSVLWRVMTIHCQSIEEFIYFSYLVHSKYIHKKIKKDPFEFREHVAHLRLAGWVRDAETSIHKYINLRCTFNLYLLRQCLRHPSLWWWAQKKASPWCKKSLHNPIWLQGYLPLPFSVEMGSWQWLIG